MRHLSNLPNVLYPTGPEDDQSTNTLDNALVAGIRFDRARAEVRVAVVSFPTLIQFESPRIVSVASSPIPSACLCDLASLETDTVSGKVLRRARMELNQVVGDTLRGSLANLDQNDELLVIGYHGSSIQLGAAGCLELFDAAQLAEGFGTTVIQDFASRDLAQNGSGEYPECQGFALLLGDRDRQPGLRWRGIVEAFEDQIRFTSVAPLTGRRIDAAVHKRLDLGPRLLSEIELHYREAGNAPIESESGTVLPGLVSLWGKSCGDLSASERAPQTSLALMYAWQQSEYRSASQADVLATAADFLAAQLADHVTREVPTSRPIGELLLLGDPVGNSRWLDSLKRRLPSLPIRVSPEIGQDRTILAAAVASLAMLHIWGIPIRSGSVREVPRVWGSTTPGCPSNWSRVLHEMTQSVPGLLPLREAI